MTDRIPGAPGQYKAAVLPQEFEKLQAGDEFTITITRDDRPIVEGTPYSKAAVLPDELAARVCPEVEDPTPADALRALHQMIYPVGAVYISVLDTDPATLFGGTWERLKDRFLLAASEDYAAGSEGGEATHTLKKEELPKHNHSFQTMYPKADGSQAEDTQRGAADYNGKTWWSLNYDNWTNGSECGNEPHNNMPPYLAVYMWKRVA